ncbi:MAG: SIMPL domain-containing protein [Chakrabartia sp.]
MRKWPVIFLSAVALAAPALAQNGAMPPAAGPAAPAGTRLDLQARGVVRVVPDMAIVSAGVVTQAGDANAALRANAARMEKVLAALRAAGLADKDLRTQAVSLSPQYRYAANEPPVITGYQASNIVSIQFRDIAKSGAILDILAQQGANDINGPNFVVENRRPAEDKARRAALRLVQDRAALYAQALGVSVRQIVSLSEIGEASAPPVPMLMARAAGDMAEAKTAILPGEQEVGVTISAVFDLGAR